MTHQGMYFAVEGNLTYGDAKYNGALFASPSTPATGTTSETITTVDAKFGQGLPLDSNIMFIPYIEGGYRYWNRNLGGGQVEDYHNFDVLGGGMLQIIPANHFFLSGFASGGTTFGGRMKTGGASYELGSTGIVKVGGKLGVDLTNKIELFTTLDYTHFRYAHSPVVNSTLEPGSGTNETTMKVGLGYHFR